MFAQFTAHGLDHDQRERIVARFSSTLSVETRTTDNPLSSVWRALQRYSGLQQARKLFTDVADEEIRNFCAYIELADQYSGVAEDADIVLDPLLLYYASMWLSRALIAARLGLPDSASIKAHGARPDPAPSEHLIMLGGRTRIYAKGTIPSLIKSLGGDPSPGKAFSLIELLQAIPEMDDALRDVLGITTSALSVSERRSEFNLGEMVVDFPYGTSLDDIVSLPIAPALWSRDARISTFPAHTPSVIWRSEGDGSAEMASLFMRTANGYFAETRIQGSYVPELAIYVLVLHALSEFSRYHPRQWLDVLSNHDGDYALIREFYAIAERKVPELVLSELSNRKIYYRHG